jgi:hypothetical protein
MTTQTADRKVPLLLWPFWAVWRLLTFILALTGRLLAAVLGFVLIVVGIVLSLTVIGAVVGVPLILFGILLAVRAIY